MLAGAHRAQAQAPACTLRATPSAIAPGQSATLSWTTENAVRGTLNHGLGALAPVDAGSKPIAPAEPIQYTANVAGPGGAASCKLTVPVTTDAGAWPPPHMKGLPPDMLERIREALQFRVLVPYPSVTGKPWRGNLSWGYLNYAIAALLLGQTPDKANEYLRKVEIFWEGTEDVGKGLLPTVARAYFLFNDTSRFLPGRLTRETQAHLQEQMWKYASFYSSLDPALQRPVQPPHLKHLSEQLTPDLANVWIGASENHHILFAASKLLYAQVLKDSPDYSSRRFADGHTAEEHYQAWRRFMSLYFDEHAKRGLFMEVAAPGYEEDTLGAIFSIYNFAEDPVLRRKAEMLLDLWFASAGQEQIGLVRGGAKSRVYGGIGSTSGAYGALWTYGSLLFGGSSARELTLSFTTSGYFPPPAVIALLQHPVGRGSYEFIERRPGVGYDPSGGRPPHGVDLRIDYVDRNKSVLRYGFATPDYIIGSVALDPNETHVRVSSQNRWQGIVFAGDTDARIFTTLPVNARGEITADNFISVQDRNVLLTRKWKNPKYNRVQVYFSRTLDRVEESGGWIFVQEGRAFAAVKPVRGGYRWTSPDRNRTAPENSLITLNDETSAIVMLANSASEYGGDFELFKASIMREPLRETGEQIEFASIRFKPGQPGERNGKVIPLRPALVFDSPFIRSEFGSGVLAIRRGSETLKLDFSNPDKPEKQAGHDAGPDYPPGTGTAKSIVFGQNRP